MTGTWQVPSRWKTGVAHATKGNPTGGIGGGISLRAGDREITSLQSEGQKSKISPLCWEAFEGIKIFARLLFLLTIGLRVRR